MLGAMCVHGSHSFSTFLMGGAVRSSHLWHMSLEVGTLQLTVLRQPCVRRASHSVVGTSKTPQEPDTESHLPACYGQGRVTS